MNINQFLNSNKRIETAFTSVRMPSEILALLKSDLKEEGHKLNDFFVACAKAHLVERGKLPKEQKRAAVK